MSRPARPAPPRWPWPPRRCSRAAAAPAPAAPGPAAEAPPGGAPFLATSLVTAAGTWAVAVMGGPVAQDNNFWQLFVRPAGSQPLEAGHPARDRRQRRPGPGRRRRVADHRVPAQPVPDLHPADHHPQRRPGLVIDRPARRGPRQRPRRPGRRPRHRAPARPAHRRHRRAGRTRLHQLDAPWPPSGPSPRRPPAAAAGCRTSPPPRSPRPGSRCSAGTCSHPGTAGIFAGTGGTWHAAGPALPAALARQPVQVLRLTSTASSTVALLAAGTGPAASLLAAWSADNGSHWALSPPLRLNGATPELGILRARRHSRDRAERQPRRDRRRPRSPVAGTARTATGHRHPGPRSRRADSTRWPSVAPR